MTLRPMGFLDECTDMDFDLNGMYLFVVGTQTAAPVCTKCTNDKVELIVHHLDQIDPSKLAEGIFLEEDGVWDWRVYNCVHDPAVVKVYQLVGVSI